jgi:moderate conductance mechanosensitive channel
MSRSLSVLAFGDAATAVSDCADYWLCQRIYDWLGLDWLAENARVLVAAAGVR